MAKFSCCNYNCFQQLICTLLVPALRFAWWFGVCLPEDDIEQLASEGTYERSFSPRASLLWQVPDDLGLHKLCCFAVCYGTDSEAPGQIPAASPYSHTSFLLGSYKTFPGSLLSSPVKLWCLPSRRENALLPQVPELKGHILEGLGFVVLYGGSAWDCSSAVPGAAPTRLH